MTNKFNFPARLPEGIWKWRANSLEEFEAFQKHFANSFKNTRLYAKGHVWNHTSYQIEECLIIAAWDYDSSFWAGRCLRVNLPELTFKHATAPLGNCYFIVENRQQALTLLSELQEMYPKLRWASADYLVAGFKEDRNAYIIRIWSDLVYWCSQKQFHLNPCWVKLSSNETHNPLFNYNKILTGLVQAQQTTPTINPARLAEEKFLAPVKASCGEDCVQSLASKMLQEAEEQLRQLGVEV